MRGESVPSGLIAAAGKVQPRLGVGWGMVAVSATGASGQAHQNSPSLGLQGDAETTDILGNGNDFVQSLCKDGKLGCW